MPYSLDLRKRVVAAAHSGMKKKAICEVYQICRQTLYNWLDLEESQGHLSPKIGFQNGHSHGIKDLEVFRRYVDAHADHTQEELADYFSVGSSTISRTLKKIEYSRKKRAKLTPNEMKKKGKCIEKI